MKETVIEKLQSLPEEWADWIRQEVAKFKGNI